MNKLNILFLFFSCSLAAQQRLEHHDIILFSLNKTADSLWQPLAPRFLTAFNAKGYNNQPNFFSNSELYLTIQTPNDTTQTEIYSLDLALKTQTRVTATPSESEYSALLLPNQRRFSAIRVEEDGNQRLWSFPLDRSDNGRPEFPKIFNVGYHCWLHDTLAALFIVGENGLPHSLYTAGIKGQKLWRVASNVGRCLQTLPDGRLAFVQKATEQTWFLKTYDYRKIYSEIVVVMPSKSEDFVALPDGTYLTGSGAKILQYRPGNNAAWKVVADISKYGVKNISRLAVSKDGKQLALVIQ